MAKRKKGKGKSKRREPMTRRDPDAKQERRAAEADDAATDESAGDEDEDADGGEEPRRATAAREAEDDDAEAEDDDAEGEDDDHAPEAEDDGEAADTPSSRGDEDAPLGLPGGAAWALPLLRFERRWLWLETRLMFVSLLALTVVLCFWIGMRGMKEPLQAQVPAGTIFRAIVGATVLGSAAWIGTRNRLNEHYRGIATVVATLVGVAVASTWRGVGITYFERLNDWLQEGSTVTLFGGLKGISTRLTMLVALIGGSLATSSGTHINIDVVVRLIPTWLRRPTAVVTALTTALVCGAASYGFFDHIAITGFYAPADAPMSAKVGVVQEEIGKQLFIWRKQVGLDLRALPHVLAGGKWNDDERMTGREWNTFLDEGGFVEEFGEEKVALVRAPESALDEPRQPFVVVPGGSAPGLLVDAMDLLWPFGFLMICLKFVLRAILTLAGHVRIQEEGEESEDHEADVEAAKEAI
ncbi:MAG: TRAP transporter small permease subunit [Polyangiaceae bacterium]